MLSFLLVFRHFAHAISFISFVISFLPFIIDRLHILYYVITSFSINITPYFHCIFLRYLRFAIRCHFFTLIDRYAFISLLAIFLRFSFAFTFSLFIAIITRYIISLILYCHWFLLRFHYRQFRHYHFIDISFLHTDIISWWPLRFRHWYHYIAYFFIIFFIIYFLRQILITDTPRWIYFLFTDVIFSILHTITFLRRFLLFHYCHYATTSITSFLSSLSLSLPLLLSWRFSLRSLRFHYFRHYFRWCRRLFHIEYCHFLHFIIIIISSFRFSSFDYTLFHYHFFFAIFFITILPLLMIDCLLLAIFLLSTIFSLPAISSFLFFLSSLFFHVSFLSLHYYFIAFAFFFHFDAISLLIDWLIISHYLIISLFSLFFIIFHYCRYFFDYINIIIFFDYCFHCWLLIID